LVLVQAKQKKTGTKEQKKKKRKKKNKKGGAGFGYGGGRGPPGFWPGGLGAKLWPRAHFWGAKFLRKKKGGTVRVVSRGIFARKFNGARNPRGE